jgi:hypothetical protein
VSTYTPLGCHMDKGRPRPNSPVCNPKTWCNMVFWFGLLSTPRWWRFVFSCLSWAVLRQCEAAGFRGGRRWCNWPGAEEGDSPSRNTETLPVFFGEVPGVGFRKRHLVKTSPDVKVNGNIV